VSGMCLRKLNIAVRVSRGRHRFTSVRKRCDERIQDDKTVDEAGKIGLCTSLRCWLETGLRSWPTQRRTRHNTYCARFSNVHRLLFGGLQDWGSCHLTKENFHVRAMGRCRNDTRENTLSLRTTIYSDQMRAAEDIRGKFLGTYS
jgi:hypothetical protein